MAVEMVPTINVAHVAKTVVKSPQEISSLELRPVNSMRRMKMVMQKQKPHVNMHPVQKESAMWPVDATRLNEAKLKITSIIRIMARGSATDLEYSATMMIHCGSGWIFRLKFLSS